MKSLEQITNLYNIHRSTASIVQVFSCPYNFGYVTVKKKNTYTILIDDVAEIKAAFSFDIPCMYYIETQSTVLCNSRQLSCYSNNFQDIPDSCGHLGVTSKRLSKQKQKGLNPTAVSPTLFREVT